MNGEEEYDGVRDLCQSLIEHQLLLVEETQELNENYSLDEFEDILFELFKEAIENSEKVRRKRMLAGIALNTGAQFNSQRVAALGQQAQENIQEKYGE